MCNKVMNLFWSFIFNQMYIVVNGPNSEQIIRQSGHTDCGLVVESDFKGSQFESHRLQFLEY